MPDLFAWENAVVIKMKHVICNLKKAAAALSSLATVGLLAIASATNEPRAMPALDLLPSVEARGAGPTLIQDPRNFQEKNIIKTAYHAPSDTYFQLVGDVVNRTGTGKWAYAVAKAERMEHKGRQGRLAVVDNADLHRWIVNTFDFEDQVWIGLRYWCAARMLVWANGREHPSSGFGAWRAIWYRDSWSQCQKNQIPYMGVYYDGNTYRWRATGPKKRFHYYLVEYPPASRPQQAESN